MSAVRRDPWLITQSGHVWRQFPSSTFLAKKLNLRTAGENTLVRPLCTNLYHQH